MSVGTLLVAPVAGPGDARDERLARFVDALFTRFPEFQNTASRPAWREVNLAATTQGWTRAQSAQDWLDGKRGAQLLAANASAPEPAAEAAARAPSQPVADAPPAQPSVVGPDAVERFKRFVQKKRGKTGAKLAQDDTVLMFEQFQKWSSAR